MAFLSGCQPPPQVAVDPSLVTDTRVVRPAGPDDILGVDSPRERGLRFMHVPYSPPASPADAMAAVATSFRNGDTMTLSRLVWQESREFYTEYFGDPGLDWATEVKWKNYAEACEGATPIAIRDDRGYATYQVKVKIDRRRKRTLWLGFRPLSGVWYLYIIDVKGVTE